MATRMSKKHYELIAKAIKVLKADYDKRANPDQYGIGESEYMYRFEGQSDAMFDIANLLSRKFAKQDPKFDRAKFLELCGVE